MTTSSKSRRSSLDLVEIKPGTKFSTATLRDMLPDAETVLFFGKVYDLDAAQLGALLHLVLNTDLTSVLFNEGGQHSHDLQDYLVGYEDEFGNWHDGIVEDHRMGDVTFYPEPPKGVILPEVWKSLEVTIAQSIKDVAKQLENVVSILPGKQGSMVFSSMMKLNVKRPTIGDYRPRIEHARQKPNLLILDVSGSMNSTTVSAIIDDVVALSYMADAHLAIVSNTCTHWVPGAYNTVDVLAAAEYGGTHYEKLHSLFDRDWGVVITVADYDSSQGAKDKLAKCKGRIDLVLDISLVNRPTFLAECVGQLADEVRPLLISNYGSSYGY